MKVFLSWSGEQSKSAAKALHDWLPTVIHTVRPYMSAENINKGQRWSVDISKQLEETDFGVICMTPENLEAPWVLFEAGALSKSMEKGHVSPLLFGLGASDLTDSPLLQFQATTFRKDDFGRLLHSMNAAAPEAEKLTKEILDRSFERAWAELEQEIGKMDFAMPKRSGKIKHEKPPEEKMELVLDELLSIARSQMKLLRSPEEMLPAGYLLKVINNARKPPNMEPGLAVLKNRLQGLMLCLSEDPIDMRKIKHSAVIIDRILGKMQSQLDEPSLFLLSDPNVRVTNSMDALRASIEAQRDADHKPDEGDGAEDS